MIWLSICARLFSSERKVKTDLSQIEQYRVMTGLFASHPDWGPNGAFMIPFNKITLQVIASNGGDWEHVSVSPATLARTPTWEEMDYIKSLFWDAQEAVMQLHPPRSRWINNHPYVLHLWRPIGIEIPAPPDYMVGVKQPAKRNRHKTHSLP